MVAIRGWLEWLKIQMYKSLKVQKTKEQKCKSTKVYQ